MLKRQLIHFALAGIAGFVVDAGTLLLVSPLAGPYAGRGISFLVAVLVTWLINRNLAFKQQRGGRSLQREFIAYLSTALVGGAASLGSYSLLVSLFGSRPASLALFVAIGSVIGMAFNFTLSKYVVFRHRA
ncbi:MAG: GtrA family protein [Proteobacteria bacterium]|nr:GtrA family protein [Pseudomonadota bacterium]